MSFQTFVFYAFSAVLVFAGLRVITTRSAANTRIAEKNQKSAV